MRKYNNCEFSFVDHEKIYESAIQALKDNKPFSFVRLGDGEGALLDFSNESEAWLVEYLSTHFSNLIKLPQILEIKKKLQETIKNADVIGTRDDIVNVSTCDIKEETFVEDFLKSFHVRETEKHISYFDAKRIFKLHSSLSRMSFDDEKIFTSPWGIYDFYLSGALPSLLSQAESIGVVNSNPAVSKSLNSAYRKKVVHIGTNEKYEITGKKTFKPYPDSYNEVVEKIEQRDLCQVYIVAAGLVGKSYCEEIRKRGGIALDLGAIVDAWVGKFSRPRVLKARFEIRKTFFSKKNKVPAELIMTHSNTQKLIEKWQKHRA